MGQNVCWSLGRRVGQFPKESMSPHLSKRSVSWFMMVTSTKLAGANVKTPTPTVSTATEAVRGL